MFDAGCSTALRPGCRLIMFKYAFISGVAAEWLLGPTADSAALVGLAVLRALMYMLLAWMICEGIGAVGKYVDTFDDRA